MHGLESGKASPPSYAPPWRGGVGGGGLFVAVTRLDFFVLVLALVFVPVNDGTAGTIFQQVGVASSPNPVGSGARAVGMGGAFIAIADDATAASWNPAGLVQLERPEASVVGAYTLRDESYTSTAHPEIATSGSVGDFSLNYLSAAMPFQVLGRNVVVSATYQRLFEFRKELDYDFIFPSPVDLSQRSSFRQSGYLGALGLAGAVQITPRISLGATLNIWTDKLGWRNGWDERFHQTGTGTQGGAPVAITTDVVDAYEEFEGVNANVGLLWDVTSLLTVGVVVKTPFDATLKHRFSFESTTNTGPPVNTTITNRQNLSEKVELSMPLSYGAALALRFSDRFSAALDVYRTHWSDYILKDGQGNAFSPIDGRPKAQSDVGDTTQVRLGAEYLFVMSRYAVPLRGGLFYDPEPSEGSPKDFYGVSVGSGVIYKRFSFDCAYQYRFARDMDSGNVISTSRADIDQHNILASMIYYF